MALGAWEPLLLLALFVVVIGLWLADIRQWDFNTSLHQWQWIAVVILLPIIRGITLYFLACGGNK